MPKRTEKAGLVTARGDALRRTDVFAKMDAEEISRIKKSVFVTGEAPAKKERNNAD